MSNLGKLPGFSIAEGYPTICNHPGTSWQVGIWNVGIPKAMVKRQGFGLLQPGGAEVLHSGERGQERLRPAVGAAVPVRH